MASFNVDSIVQVANDYALEHLRGAVGTAQQIRADDGAIWVVFGTKVRSGNTANFIRAAWIPSASLVPYTEPEPDTLPPQVSSLLPADVISSIQGFAELLPGVAWSNALMKELHDSLSNSCCWHAAVQAERAGGCELQ